MKSFLNILLFSLLSVSIATSAAEKIGLSPWGGGDEIGQLNLMTAASRSTVISNANADTIYDLSVDYYIGMPAFDALGGPTYQHWMIRTPRGTIVDDPAKVGKEQNQKASYSGDALSMNTHTGTHIDGLTHFGLNGKIWNNFSADEHLGDAGWKKAGAETIPPIIARGILVDLAEAKNIAMLPPGYRVTDTDIKEALKRQKTYLQRGDVVLLRTGRMALYKNKDAFLNNMPGLSMSGAKFLADSGSMIIGADNLAMEVFPSESKDNWIPVHTYLIAQRGIPLIEMINLEDLSRARLYEFAFIAASLKLRGATGAPIRPIAMPFK